MHLTTNMRVQFQNDPTAVIFSMQLLKVGNGTVSTDLETFSLLKVFWNIETKYQNHAWMSGRAILADKSVDVHDINNIILNRIVDETVTH